MPVADQNENQNEHSNDEKPGGLVLINVMLVMLRRRRIGLRFGRGSGHEDIVSPSPSLWNFHLRC
jgi:hypothetical protein